MPTSLSKLYEEFNVGDYRKVSRGRKIERSGQGVYIVALTDDINSRSQFEPVFNDRIIETWVNKLPSFMVDGGRATASSVKARLMQFWIPDECILYIGKAPFRSNPNSGLAKRVGEYFSTEIGD